MKTSILSLLVIGLCLSAKGQNLDYLKNRPLPSQAEGLAAVARELVGDASFASRSAVAVVKKVETSDASEVKPKKWSNDYTKIGMIDLPTRINFELTVLSWAHRSESGPFGVIQWVTDFASNWTESGKLSLFNHKFNHHREAVMAMPLTAGTIICFIPPILQNDGLTKSLKVLPSGSVDELKAAVSWRVVHGHLFRPDDVVDDEIVKSLKLELVNQNCYVRLSVMLQLIKYRELTAAEVEVLLKATVKPVEAAATTLLIITQAPALAASIANILNEPIANGMIFEGITIGAASHFLNLPDSERLLGAARVFQLLRGNNPAVPDNLKETISFPLLLKQVDSLTGPDGRMTIEVSTLQFKLLKATSALRRTGTAKPPH